MSNRFFILLLFACLQFYNVKSGNAFYPESTFLTQEDTYFFHTVEKGQTVFSIASMYHVAVEEIYALNPESKTLVKVGEKLKIPQESGSYVYHVIQPQETLYGLSQKYQLKGEDILAVNQGLSIQTFQIGKVVRIPVNRVNTPQAKGGNDAINKLKTNSLLHQIYSTQSVKTIQVALLLPFGLKENTDSDNSSVNRMIEYYEGFLLALKTLKSKKISVDLQVYNIGSDAKEISDILKKEEMQQVHLIIGGLSEEQIRIISRFSSEKNIPYIIPFTSMSSEPFNNALTFQVNTPQAILYAKASTAFINKYRNYRIILVSGEKEANQSEFTGLLRKDLQEKGMSFKTIPVKRFFDSDFVSELDLYRDNVFVPDDDSPATIEKIIAPLKAIQESHPEYQISLFGYPRWQTYSSKYSDGFYRLHTSFFSVFYADVTSWEIKDFYDTFYKWYGRNISNNFPKFGLLGYDTGMYFLQSIYIHGTSFDKEINELRYKGLQTEFYFERVNNWGGFINTNLFVVDYNPDNSITRTSLK